MISLGVPLPATPRPPHPLQNVSTLHSAKHCPLQRHVDSWVLQIDKNIEPAKQENKWRCVTGYRGHRNSAHGGRACSSFYLCAHPTVCSGHLQAIGRFDPSNTSCAIKV